MASYKSERILKTAYVVKKLYEKGLVNFKDIAVHVASPKTEKVAKEIIKKIITSK